MSYSPGFTPWNDIPDSFPFFRAGEHADVIDPLFRASKRGSAIRARDRQFREAPIEVFPGIFSWDWDYQQLLRSLAATLSKECPTDLDDYGRVLSSGIRGNFFGLLHLPGAPMIPATIPMGDNRAKRKAAKLADGPLSQVDEWIFRAVIECMFEGYENDGLRIARGTSTGIPFFENFMTAKVEQALAAMASAPVAAKLVQISDFEGAFTHHGIGGAYYVVYREQTTDKVERQDDGSFRSKDRSVADLAYAISGGTKGSLSVSSKDPSSLREQGYRIHKDFSRTRRRTAQAGPFALNSLLMTVAQPCRKRMYENYAFSWHHTTRKQKQESIAPFADGIATDVSDHDTYWASSWYVPLFIDQLEKMGFNPEFLALVELSFRLPVYVSAPSPDPDLCSILVGDWRDPKLSQGLPSGNGLTDMAGTGKMSACYCIMQLNHLMPEKKAELARTNYSTTLEYVRSYLRGEREIAAKSKSDDALLLARPGIAASRMPALREKMKQGEQVSDYMVISYEVGTAFLGDVLVYDSTKSLTNARFMGNMISYVSNMFVPEYSIDTDRPVHLRRRRFPGLAVATAPTVFGDCPTWQVVNDIIEFEWARVYGSSFRRMRQAQLEADTKALAQYVKERTDLTGVRNLSLIDSEVIADPSKLSWKYATSDVSEIVLELFSSGPKATETLEFSKFVK